MSSAARPPDPRPAATVVLLREQPEGLAVFLVQRNRQVAFMPSAWVFPGGRVDRGDALHGHPRVRGGAAAAARMGLSAEQAVPFLAAAVRETYEESGIWLGSGRPPAAARDALNARERGLVEVLDEHDLAVDLDGLIPWSWWVTPVNEPRRYDTRFFLALVETDEGMHDDGETVASAWLPVAEAVRRAEAGALPMAPPTWWTLRELDAHTDASRLGHAGRPDVPICPILQTVSGSLSLLLPGHEQHPDPAVPGLPRRVRFGQGRWWADGG